MERGNEERKRSLVLWVIRGSFSWSLPSLEVCRMDEVQFGEDIVDHNVWFGFYDGFTSFCFADVRKRKKGNETICALLDFPVVIF
jgi:hypothetical protein